MTASTMTSAALVTRYVGKCPICENEQKLTAGRKMVHHGFKRPDIGHIVGDCMAVGHDPYEISCEITKVYRGGCVSHLADLNAYRIRLVSGEVKEIKVTNWRKEERIVTAANADFQYELNGLIARVDSEIRAYTSEIARLTALIDNWKLQPLRTVEEFEAPKAAAKAAAKADRAAAKAVKFAAKVASYQRRIDSAVKNKKAHIVAEIFESAGRCMRQDWEISRTKALKPLERDSVFAAFGLDITQDHHADANREILSTMSGSQYPWGTKVWPTSL